MHHAGPGGTEDQTDRRPEPEQLFREQLSTIESMASCVAQALPAADRDDFSSYVMLRLIENDYSVLRKHSGAGSLRSYLSRVIQRMLVDWRVSHWGRWRDSAAARRMGPLAVQLERMLLRDGYSLDEAVRSLQTHECGDVSDNELRTMAARLPARVCRRPEGGSELANALSPERCDDRMLDSERSQATRRIERVLRRTVEGLSDEDRRLLRLRYQHSQSVPSIAAALGSEPRPLYHRVERLLKSLRNELEKDGIRGADIAGELPHLGDELRLEAIWVN